MARESMGLSTGPEFDAKAIPLRQPKKESFCGNLTFPEKLHKTSTK